MFYPDMKQINNTGINLVKPTKFYLLSEPVNIYIPLPKQTCSNWNESHTYPENIGVIYKGLQITLKQLQHIITCYENIADYKIHELTKTTVKFDGQLVTLKNINDIKRIFEAVIKVQPRDRYGDKRDFKQDVKIVL